MQGTVDQVEELITSSTEGEPEVGQRLESHSRH